MGELGRYKIRPYVDIQIIRYWLRCIQGNAPCFVKDCYSYQYDRTEKGYNCWGSFVKKLLFKYGFGEVWVNQGVENTDYFLLLFKQRCYDIQRQEWHSNINSVPKLRTYCKFKVNLALEKYLNCIDVPIFRNALVSLRLSTHSLLIEKGRDTGLSVEQIICPFGCKCIEDEYHFVLVCPKYLHFRIKFIPEYYFNPPFEWKFLLLMKSEKPFTLNNLGKYTFFAMKERRRLLDQ